jgi:hypothetical protein
VQPLALAFVPLLHAPLLPLLHRLHQQHLPLHAPPMALLLPPVYLPLLRLLLLPPYYFLNYLD